MGYFGVNCIHPLLDLGLDKSVFNSYSFKIILVFNASCLIFIHHFSFYIYDIIIYRTHINISNVINIDFTNNYQRDKICFIKIKGKTKVFLYGLHVYQYYSHI